ncbi:alpha/beta fold hydrolase [Ancylobacter defluvii]|uniref:Peptidase M13 n=1 Tax=Ancylobacter defluvii TaxID=1282440 RepID=A0A9W6NCE2_9HYPH|nr:alpha/beta fold hydrolase [Ancylobacter defluvii]MBS7588092.1 alpha/beta fold hydrolase [Ancylobacter defluvii]GLK86484.1 peptidase M13 [Ancylobacter defluvii]
MANFVLVHGSFHGAWCWQRLVPLLEARGHTVLAPDLPASGGDPALPETADLDSYVTRVCWAIDQLPDDVVLVGHSMGGIVSAQASERRAHRLAATVYVNGLLLTHGASLVSFLDAHADLGVEDLVLKNMQVAAGGQTATFPAAAAGEVFYNSCTPEDAAWAAGQLTPQRMKIYADRLDLSAARFGRVRRFYVEGTRDKAVSLAYQRAMTEETPCEAVFTLEGDHSPFLSAPEALAGLLDTVVARVGI